ncbi:formate C-acetyltransferase [Ruminococcaceae bacterium OttesenSCG-928-L11]|nr:formate C-acetyltransferase [Ruminococcaceae bacterium OttesenSCG-928-L11]
MNFTQWNGFNGTGWKETIDVQAFIRANVTPYHGDESFLAGPTQRTTRMMERVADLFAREREQGGVLDIDVETVSSLNAYAPGYVDREQELIVGLQTDAPLKRGVNPFGGIRMARQACEAYGHKLSQRVEDEFQYRTTHNSGVFRVYTDEMLAVRRAGLLTGLPDAYGRGRIIGDYRRVALYGAQALIEGKRADKAAIGRGHMNADTIRQSEELFQQINFLNMMVTMAADYGCDITEPARNTREAVQWLYFAYLGAIKEQNGAAMSLGRVSSFLDIYATRDLEQGICTESEIQEIMDDFVIKLRLARHLRTPEYNDLFGGDPMWITECVGGMAEDGGTLVTRNSYRFLHTLYNLGPAPEPNITVLWSEALPEPFKAYCAKVSIDTDSIQYENDDLMRPRYGDDYGIACCVSAMKIGKQMQFFGARCNLPKLLLLALNGGRLEGGVQLGPQMEPMTGRLEADAVAKRLDIYMDWLTALYVNTMNVIHYMHDKYAYEKLQMALHDTDVERVMAFGVAGLSVITDSLSAIRHAVCTPILRDGVIADFHVEGDFPRYGNDDDRVDTIARQLTSDFIAKLRSTPAYRGAVHTLSVLTITSNVAYGRMTGATPDGRAKGEPFAPGANPMHGRDESGALASLSSVAKLNYDDCRDGISCTFSIVPDALGKGDADRTANLVRILDGYFGQSAHHLNVNVLDREKLEAAYENPDAYPDLTIRVSGYAVNFGKLNREQQKEVIRRTFHGRV